MGHCNPRQVFLVTTNNQEPPICLLRYCVIKATSFRSATCIPDRESRSSEPSFSVNLHRERANKVFGKQSLRLLTRFLKLFITAHLPLRRTRAESHCLQHEFRPADHHIHLIVIVREPQVMYGFLLSNHVLYIEYVDLYRYDFARLSITIFPTHCYDRSI
jgi:hypothetical protein